MQGFWDDIDLMQAVTRIMVWAAAVLLLIACAGWFLQRPFFAINQFRFVGDVTQLEAKPTHDLIEQNLGQGLAGGFFSMNLYQVQNSLQTLSWVKTTSVRKLWPHTIEINITEHTPLAIWKDGYLSPEGQLFATRLSDTQRAKLIQAEGPDAASKLVADQIPMMRQWFAPLGWTVKKVALSERYSWQVWFENGVLVELGRADTPSALEERVRRLEQSMDFIQENIGSTGAYIDLRYPNGFAMRSDKLHRVAASAQTMINTGEKHE
jgi:cell division protein FtsQ